MKNYCIICFTNSGIFNREIVGVCRELSNPVCELHAKTCTEDGHGTSPLPEDILRRKSKPISPWPSKPDPRCICNNPLMISIKAGQCIIIDCPVHGNSVGVEKS